jgi:hypothetical protein
MSRFLKLSLISFVLACMLMPLVAVVERFVRVRLEMRDPVARSIHVAGIASGIGAIEVITIFLLLFCFSFLLSRRLLN